ncbi:MAG TPA: ABC transporter permease [Gammaproteobacteria bacterium]|nr:ABC transporter permease [Gammaproteobacteria bacterium]
MDAIVARLTASNARICLLESRSEFLRMWRTPGAVIPMLAFPVMFYAFFGVMLAKGEHGMEQSIYALAGLGSFGVMGPGLFGFGTGFAIDRGLGWLQLKRATPMPPLAYLLAKVAMAMLFGCLVTALLFAMAAFLAHVHLQPGQWLQLFVTLVLGSVPFCALGLAVGAWVKPASASAMVNAIYLPMSFLSGLWMPLQFLPKFIQQLATLLPAYHLGKLAYGAAGVSQDSLLPHVGALAAFTAAFLALAARGYRRNPPSSG